MQEFDGLNNLKELDLSQNAIVSISALNGLCELKTLRELDVTGSGFGDTLPWCLANLTSLRLLDITSNHFTGNIARSPLINLTSLEYLAISYNKFEIPISFKSFFNHSKLKFIKSLNNTLVEEEDFPARSPSFQLIGLRLSNSNHGHITRSFPRFLYHQHDLILVELSRTDFIGKFPCWLLDNNTRMETLILSYNSLVGPLLLPTRHMTNLLMLDISNNHLEGFLPYKIASPFQSLESFDLSTNNFEGNIPSSFGDMSALKMLDFSNNGLSGEIPVHLAKGCSFLFFLILSNNKLKGPVLPYQNNLPHLQVLYADNNSFTEIPSSLYRSALLILDVSGNQLAGKIPVFIGNISLWVLAMAGNQLEGPIPIEFCRLEGLRLLDLSENNITGAVPSCFSSSPINNIRLSKNRLDGPLPMAFKNYSTNLMELDLSYNQFSGSIPTWIGSFSNLSVLLLQNNSFEGNIPKELCNLSSLTMIDLSFNNLFGSIPPCISKIEFNGMRPSLVGVGISVDDSRHIFKLMLHDLRMVLLKSEIETIKDLSYDRSTKAEEVEFLTKGMPLSYKGIVLYLFSGINLSHNKLTGPIPPEIGNLSHIKVLNLSHNNFTGSIPVTFSNLKSIESLDLSYNRLHGKIPSQLTELTFLVVFYLSYNNLSGRTPQRIFQFANFEWSSYVGNPLLCGEPLPRKCSATDSPPSTPRTAVNDTEEDFGFMDMDVFYMSFAGSYVTVVLAIVAILLINPYWRRAWFHLVEVSITSCYYFVVDNLVGRRRCFHWK
ncbi:hypothetical protein RHGRI_000455 [Rhododendron griersonianum]|uniref:Uncharacterized protein n=1 Tax=Rhododendron griersonianum TaxID=479676 RepID=A0AAV6LHQ4_9ERIC|nr:hypothetical protein RHGRI_000455 [Rhododendron griersonianum]